MAQAQGYDGGKSMGSDGGWQDSAKYGKQKKEDFSYKNYRDLSGAEVFCNAHTEVSYMSSYFLSKWQQVNKTSEILMNGREGVVPVKIGGRIYPVYIHMTEDLSPLTLGSDFFSHNNWKWKTEDKIQTPYETLHTEGTIFGKLIDSDLADKVFTTEEVTQKKGTREEKIRKLHKYFGHASGDSLWRVVKHSSNPEQYTKVEVQRLCDECQVCQLSRRKQPRKKTSLPRSTAFNQVVTMDLKVHGDGNYILWMCDDATRLIRGEVIKNKEPETILAAMEKIWINGYGMGPGMPEKYFMSDNGGEFINSKLLNLCQEAGIKLIKTGSYSPQQNGLNERNHGVADVVIEKILREDPTLTMQEAVNKSAWARNSLINKTGFSPFQLVFGRSPILQGASECTTGGLEELTPNETARSMLYQQEQVRQIMRRVETDWRVKTAMKDRLPTHTNIIHGAGDYVVFKDGKDGKNHEGRIIGFDGPIALIKWGNADRRVPKTDLLPSHEIHQELEDSDEEEEMIIKEEDGENQESESETEVIQEIQPRRRGPKRKRKTEVIPEIPEKQVIREEKNTRKTEEEDKKTWEIWSDCEEDQCRIQNHDLTLPRTHSYINMWNNWGEKFSGFVVQLHRKNRTQFKIQEIQPEGIKAETWVDLRKLNYWEYGEPPNLEEIALCMYGEVSVTAREAACEPEL